MLREKISQLEADPARASDLEVNLDLVYESKKVHIRNSTWLKQYRRYTYSYYAACNLRTRTREKGSSYWIVVQEGGKTLENNFVEPIEEGWKLAPSIGARVENGTLGGKVVGEIDNLTGLVPVKVTPLSFLALAFLVGASRSGLSQRR